MHNFTIVIYCGFQPSLEALLLKCQAGDVMILNKINEVVYFLLITDISEIKGREHCNWDSLIPRAK